MKKNIFIDKSSLGIIVTSFLCLISLFIVSCDNMKSSMISVAGTVPDSPEDVVVPVGVDSSEPDVVSIREEPGETIAVHPSEEFPDSVVVRPRDDSSDPGVVERPEENADSVVVRPRDDSSDPGVVERPEENADSVVVRPRDDPTDPVVVEPPRITVVVVNTGTHGVHVRDTALLDRSERNIIGHMLNGTRGHVIDGPKYNSNLTWWKIEWLSGDCEINKRVPCIGWSAEADTDGTPPFRIFRLGVNFYESLCRRILFDRVCG